MTPLHYFDRPTNLAFHDLTTNVKPPWNLRSLLGLGLKFIPTPSEPTKWKDLERADATLPRLKRSIRLRCFFSNKPPLTSTDASSDYNPRLYSRSSWEPKKWAIPYQLTRRLTSFEEALRPRYSQPKKIRSNLLPHQRYALMSLRNRPDLLVVQCDKNLGPAVIERSQYIRMAFRDHLQDATTYRCLSPESALEYKTLLEDKLREWLANHKAVISKNEMRFLKNLASKCADPFPYFYLTMKVHKSPLKSRPIVSCSGSLLHGIGLWLDDQLQVVAQSLPSYVKSSFDVKQQVTGLHLPHNARLFTADAVSMYTNIPTSTALREIKRYLLDNSHQFPKLNVAAVTQALELIMTHNVVQFGDTHWLQLSGTAMGTPPAPAYATIFYGIHEATILERFAAIGPARRLGYYRRYIDDILGIWIPHPSPRRNERDWLAFQELLNEFHLTWEVSPLATEVNFLDITLTLHEQRIKTNLFQKPLNLYLFIPPKSAHPPGVLPGLISGTIYRIHMLCSEPPDIKHHLQTFWNRLLARGYTKEQLLLPFQRGINRALQHVTQTTTSDDSDTQTLFFHIQYHPSDPNSKTIQQLWRSHVSSPAYCMPLEQIPVTAHDRSRHQFGISRLTVCYSRPPNLGNQLSYRKIQPNSGPAVSSFQPD